MLFRHLRGETIFYKNLPKVNEICADIEFMSDFLGKLKAGIEKLTVPPDTADTALKNDTIPKDSMFLKEEIEFQNADTLVREKTTEELIQEDIIRQFSQKKPEIPDNPKLTEIKSRIFLDTGRNFDESELTGFLELNQQQTEIAKKLIKEDEHKLFSGDDIAVIAANVREENFDKVKKIMKMEESLFVFEALDIAQISSLTEEQIEKIKRLSFLGERQSGFSGSELFLLAQIPDDVLNKYFERDPDFAVEKLTGTCIALESYNDGSKRIFDVYDTEQKSLVETRTEEYNDNIRTETIENQKNNIKQVIKTESDTETILEEKIYRYDRNGNLVSTVTLNNSDGILEQNVSKTDKTGRQIPVQWASKDKDTGNMVIQKSFTSYDGTKTDYYYEETPDGVKISDYRITDKDGNILLDEHTTFQPVKGSDNKFLSSENGRVFEITHTPEKIQVTDRSTGEKVELETAKIAPGRPENVMQVLKELPGSYLMQIAKNPITIESSDFDPGLWGNYSKILYLGVPSWFSGEDEQFSVFMHEMGHYIDTEKESEKYGIISQNKELKEIYNQELANFKKNSTVRQQEFVDYFIGGIPKNARAETMAESTMILSTPYSSRRSLYLQQHFPRTIAKIAELTKSVLSENQ